MRTTAVLGAGVLAALLGACESPHGCTAIGAESGVAVQVPGRSSRSLQQVEVCTQGRCAVAGPRGPSDLWATIDSIRSTDPVDVEIRRAGRTVLTTRVTPSRTQPNGPGCDPVAFQATVTLPHP